MNAFFVMSFLIYRILPSKVEIDDYSISITLFYNHQLTNYYYLKRLICSLICLCMAVMSFADPLTIKPKPFPNPGGGNGSGHAPALYPTVTADLTNTTLSVNATVFDPEWITVTIYDEDDNIVLSGAYSSSTVFGINLSSLPSGNYTIKLEIDGYSYYYEGEFEII